MAETTMYPPELQTEELAVQRRRKMAELLMQQSMQGQQGIQAGKFYVPPNPLSPLVQGLQALAGVKGMERADTASGDIAKRYQTGMADEVRRISAMRRGTTTAPDQQEYEQAADQGTAEPKVTSTGDPRGAIQAALLSQYKPVQQMGVLEHKTFENEQTKQGDRDARLHERVLTLDAAAINQSISREDRAAAAVQAAALRREIQANEHRFAARQNEQNREVRRDVLAAAEAQRQQKNVPKLPTPALKLQQEELDAIGTGSAIQADLNAVLTQLSPGVDAKTGAPTPPTLQLGPVRNVVGAARNMAGMSNESSKNLASFKSTLEKLRNDSLRLNKGVQTEGDAVRAWNEILANVTDQEFVKKRLGEVVKMNERAVTLRKNNVDVIRGNFGLEPLDTTGYTNQPAAVGGGSGLSAAEQAELNQLRQRFLGSGR